MGMICIEKWRVGCPRKRGSFEASEGAGFAGQDCVNSAKNELFRGLLFFCFVFFLSKKENEKIISKYEDGLADTYFNFFSNFNHH